MLAFVEDFPSIVNNVFLWIAYCDNHDTVQYSAKEFSIFWIVNLFLGLPSTLSGNSFREKLPASLLCNHLASGTYHVDSSCCSIEKHLDSISIPSQLFVHLKGGGYNWWKLLFLFMFPWLIAGLLEEIKLPSLCLNFGPDFVMHAPVVVLTCKMMVTMNFSSLGLLTSFVFPALYPKNKFAEKFEANESSCGVMLCLLC